MKPRIEESARVFADEFFKDSQQSQQYHLA